MVSGTKDLDFRNHKRIWILGIFFHLHMNEMYNARTTWDAVSPWHSRSKHGGHPSDWNLLCSYYLEPSSVIRYIFWV